MGPRWSKVLADLRANKTRTILVALSISVGVFVVGVIIDSQTTIRRDMAQAYGSVRPASATLISHTLFDSDTVRAVQSMAEVGDAEGRCDFLVRARRLGDRQWFRLELTALRDYDDVRINLIHSEAGAWPPPAHEVLIERASLAYMKGRVGDTLEVETPDGVTRRLRVGGLVHDMNAIPPQYEAPHLGYISFDTLEWLGQPRRFNQLLFTVADGPSAGDKTYIQRVATHIRDDKLGGDGSVMIPQTPGAPPLGFVTDAMMGVLGALSLLVLLPSGFLVVNTISGLLGRQTNQIGIMKAMGAHTGQITAMYLVLALAFGVLALIIPLPLAALGARAFSSYWGSVLNFELGRFTFSPRGTLMEAAIALLLPPLAALWPVLAATRITVRQAISSRGLVPIPVRAANTAGFSSLKVGGGQGAGQPGRLLLPRALCSSRCATASAREAGCSSPSSH